LPASYHAVVAGGLAELGFTLQPPVLGAIADHVRLLLAWTPAINLTAIREPGDVAGQHVLDSLTAVPVVRATGARRLLDLGSGGGFPGIPVALAVPVETAVLVDSVAKKARFLDVVAHALGMADRISVRAVRAEALASGATRGRWDLVTARAVAPLGELVELGFPLLETGGHVVAWKGPGIDSELAGAARAVDALGGGSIRVEVPGLSAVPGHRLVIVRKFGPTDARYPRDPSERRRRPW
jgi:16S rRNA (guanine527-N7)-methyltransferase